MNRHEALLTKAKGMFRHTHAARWFISITFIIIIAAIAWGAWYTNKQFTETDEQLLILSEKISILADNLSISKQELEATLAERSSTLEDQLGTYRSEIRKVSGTVTTLEKLSKTDPELLQKYSKVFFLNEHYAPPRLAEVPNEYKYDEDRTIRVHAQVWPYLEDMLEEALDDDIYLYVSSGFRSFNEQSALKGQYTVTYGAGTANTFSADQGYSEHQLGTTVDFTTKGIGGGLAGFDTTPAFTWLQNNAHEYGFVLSYPENNTHYVYEPWHWRFVGTELATDLHKDGKNFYDMDQRDIDEYLVEVFE